MGYYANTFLYKQIVFATIRNNKNNYVMKDSVSSQIFQDIQTAWNTLNPQHIIKHLDKCFIYNSQWVFESLDYERYISYLTGKFNKIRETGCIVEATIVDGAVRLNQNGSIAFYRVKIENGKIIAGNISFGRHCDGSQKR